MTTANYQPRSAQTPPQAPGRDARSQQPAPARPPVQRVEVRRLTPEEYKGKLEKEITKRFARFAEVAPAGFTEDMVKRLLSQAVYVACNDRRILACSTGSIFSSIRQAVELGLDLAGAMPGAWLAPFKEHGKPLCRLMIGYQGMVDLAYRSEVVQLIESRIVYENDEFEIDYGNYTKPLTHKPEIGSDRGGIEGAYALAFRKGLERPAIEWMPYEEIMSIREGSRSKGQSAWDTHFSEMARKCPVRRIFKYLPKSTTIDRMLLIDRESDGLAETTALTAPTPTGKASNLDTIGAALGINKKPDGPTLDRSTAQDFGDDENGQEFNEADITF